MPAGKCTFNPRELTGIPIGMFHCPECGEMVIAGCDHPDYPLNITEPGPTPEKNRDNTRANT